MSLERQPAGLVLKLAWRNLAAWALMPMSLGLAGFSVLLFYKLHDVSWNDPIQLIPLVFGGAGMVFLYVVIRRFVNVTRLEITPQRIAISHGPLPWRRATEFAAKGIRRIDVRPYRWRYNGSEATHYHVWVVDDDRKEICLLERDTTKEQAEYVCNEVRRALDCHVEGQPSESALK